MPEIEMLKEVLKWMESLPYTADASKAFDLVQKVISSLEKEIDDGK